MESAKSEAAPPAPEAPPHHPMYPQSNVAKFSGYDPNLYALDNVSTTVRVDEDLIPGKPVCLTQSTVGMFLQPLTRELVEVPPRPTIDELPDAVINKMVTKDKAFWVCKPGANAYTLHDAYESYGMTTEKVLPTRQDVFPRSYQYDLDCVRYRRFHGCDGLKQPKSEGQGRKPKTKPGGPHCRDCQRMDIPGLTPFQLAWAKDAGQKRWRYYPDLNRPISDTEMREMMYQVGRPFQNEACNWYYKNYPPVKYDVIIRKFSQ